jgi:hypothetical protein
VVAELPGDPLDGHVLEAAGVEHLAAHLRTGEAGRRLNLRALGERPLHPRLRGEAQDQRRNGKQDVEEHGCPSFGAGLGYMKTT